MNSISELSQPKPMLPRYLVVIILSAISAFALFHEPIVKVILEVLSRDESSHGFFVPFLTVYFFWTIKDRLRQTEIKLSWTGIPLIAFCLILALLKIGNFQIQFIAFIFLVMGLVLSFLGWDMFKATSFPILFLVTMTPLPPDLYGRLANISRAIAFGGSLKVISLFGIPYFRDGWAIELPNSTLHVAISCSGIRYLISFFVFGLAYAYLFKKSAPSRIATVLATIPISIFSSVCRLTIIFMMTYWVSPFWGQHRPHIILSWFVFFVVLFSSIFIDQAVQKRMEGHG